jgi:hypothetical protein
LNNNTDVAKPLVFEPVSLTHRERVESIRSACGNTLYVNTFASLFAWQTDEQYEICFHNNAFIIKNGAVGDNAYLFPCGDDGDKEELINVLIQYEKPSFYSVTDEDKLFLESRYPDSFEFAECRDEFVYIYDRAEQVAVRGKKFKSLRHHVNSGRAMADEWTIEPLGGENAQRALEINRKWAESKGDYVLADTVAARRALEHFSQLSLWGLLFKADGEDAAYVAGSFITPEIFDLCFCKVLNRGCDFFVRWAACNALPPEVTTIDCEEDLGIEGLRINKLSRMPKELIRIWKGSYI